MLCLNPEAKHKSKHGFCYGLMSVVQEYKVGIVLLVS